MRDCKNCKHLIMYDYKNKSYSCEKWECKFEPKEQEPTDKNFTKADIDAIVKAINAHWELIIDEIRVEIEGLDYITFDGITKRRCLEIIDKYKAEREALADIYKPTLKADLCIMDEFAFMPQAETEDT